ncbi:MAG TPA: hypothetical protein VMV86_06905 [Methanosarcinales archaeon]|nr:hypothetical protein [Methanosarcinales archaeon]
MNLLELKSFIDMAIESAKEHGEDPAEVIVSIQIDDTESESLWSDDIELKYDNNCQASGCVLHGWTKEPSTERQRIVAEIRAMKIIASQTRNILAIPLRQDVVNATIEEIADRINREVSRE